MGRPRHIEIAAGSPAINVLNESAAVVLTLASPRAGCGQERSAHGLRDPFRGKLEDLVSADSVESMVHCQDPLVHGAVL